MADTTAVLTGPIQGEVTLADGTVIDVSPALIYVSSRERAAEVADAIGRSYAENGHPTDPNFTYIPPEG